MNPTIRVDEEVYARLKDEAEPFVDTPNSVLRRLFGLPSKNGAQADPDTGEALGTSEPGARKPRRAASPGRSMARKDRGRGRRKRVTRGSLVPQADYELPILQVLLEKGGRAPSREVIDAIEPLMGDKLKGVDRSKTSSGEIRWRNRAQFVRLSLIEKGELAKDSPRGVWEITEAGRTRVQKD
jgi:hypothetical protein